jgi:hypothetical protein
MWPLDEDAPGTLERIRAAYALFADAGDDNPMTIVQAVDGMITEVRQLAVSGESRTWAECETCGTSPI